MSQGEGSGAHPAPTSTHHATPATHSLATPPARSGHPGRAALLPWLAGIFDGLPVVGVHILTDLIGPVTGLAPDDDRAIGLDDHGRGGNLERVPLDADIGQPLATPEGVEDDGPAIEIDRRR